MECPNCHLRFTKKGRIPKINQCSHTICSICIQEIEACPICREAISSEKAITNQSILDISAGHKSDIQIDKFIKVCFVGESKVGKTSLINRLKGQQYKENTIATIGYDFVFEDRQVSNYLIRFQFWDSAGQQKFRAITPLHYKNADILIVVYDISQPAEKNRVDSWYAEASKHCPQRTIKILVGNKIDLLQNSKVVSSNPLSHTMWKTMVADKISNYELSCKTSDGLAEFWKILEENAMLHIAKKLGVTANPNELKTTAKSSKLSNPKMANKKQNNCC